MFQTNRTVKITGAINLTAALNQSLGILKDVALRLISLTIFSVLNNQPTATVSIMPIKIRVKLLHQLSTISSTARPAPVE